MVVEVSTGAEAGLGGLGCSGGYSVIVGLDFPPPFSHHSDLADSTNRLDGLSLVAVLLF